MMIHCLHTMQTALQCNDVIMNESIFTISHTPMPTVYHIPWHLEPTMDYIATKDVLYDELQLPLLIVKEIIKYLKQICVPSKGLIALPVPLKRRFYCLLCIADPETNVTYYIDMDATGERCSMTKYVPSTFDVKFVYGAWYLHVDLHQSDQKTYQLIAHVTEY
jgi:hypothetical protein